ncbi:MAG: hypothetical protein ACTSU2_09975 [Promethearchaeota archaeon]
MEGNMRETNKMGGYKANNDNRNKIKEQGKNEEEKTIGGQDHLGDNKYLEFYKRVSDDLKKDLKFDPFRKAPLEIKVKYIEKPESIEDYNFGSNWQYIDKNKDSILYIEVYNERLIRPIILREAFLSYIPEIVRDDPFLLSILTSRVATDNCYLDTDELNEYKWLDNKIMGAILDSVKDNHRIRILIETAEKPLRAVGVNKYLKDIIYIVAHNVPFLDDHSTEFINTILDELFYNDQLYNPFRIEEVIFLKSLYKYIKRINKPFSYDGFSNWLIGSYFNEAEGLEKDLLKFMIKHHKINEFIKSFENRLSNFVYGINYEAINLGFYYLILFLNPELPEYYIDYILFPIKRILVRFRNLSDNFYKLTSFILYPINSEEKLERYFRDLKTNNIIIDGFLIRIKKHNLSLSLYDLVDFRVNWDNWTNDLRTNDLIKLKNVKAKEDMKTEKRLHKTRNVARDLGSINLDKYFGKVISKEYISPIYRSIFKRSEYHKGPKSISKKVNTKTKNRRAATTDKKTKKDNSEDNEQLKPQEYKRALSAIIRSIKPMMKSEKLINTIDYFRRPNISFDLIDLVLIDIFRFSKRISYSNILYQDLALNLKNNLKVLKTKLLGNILKIKKLKKFFEMDIRESSLLSLLETLIPGNWRANFKYSKLDNTSKDKGSDEDIGKESTRLKILRNRDILKYLIKYFGYNETFFYFSKVMNLLLLIDVYLKRYKDNGGNVYDLLNIIKLDFNKEINLKFNEFDLEMQFLNSINSIVFFLSFIKNNNYLNYIFNFPADFNPREFILRSLKRLLSNPKKFYDLYTMVNYFIDYFNLMNEEPRPLLELEQEYFNALKYIQEYLGVPFNQFYHKIINKVESYIKNKIIIPKMDNSLCVNVVNSKSIMLIEKENEDDLDENEQGGNNRDNAKETNKDKESEVGDHNNDDHLGEAGSSSLSSSSLDYSDHLIDEFRKIAPVTSEYYGKDLISGKDYAFFELFTNHSIKVKFDKITDSIFGPRKKFLNTYFEDYFISFNLSFFIPNDLKKGQVSMPKNTKFLKYLPNLLELRKVFEMQRKAIKSEDAKGGILKGGALKGDALKGEENSLTEKANAISSNTLIAETEQVDDNPKILKSKVKTIKPFEINNVNFEKPTNPFFKDNLVNPLKNKIPSYRYQRPSKHTSHIPKLNLKDYSYFTDIDVEILNNWENLIARIQQEDIFQLFKNDEFRKKILNLKKIYKIILYPDLPKFKFEQYLLIINLEPKQDITNIKSLQNIIPTIPLKKSSAGSRHGSPMPYKNKGMTSNISLNNNLLNKLILVPGTLQIRESRDSLSNEFYFIDYIFPQNKPLYKLLNYMTNKKLISSFLLLKINKIYFFNNPFNFREKDLWNKQYTSWFFIIKKILSESINYIMIKPFTIDLDKTPAIHSKIDIDTLKEIKDYAWKDIKKYMNLRSFNKINKLIQSKALIPIIEPDFSQIGLTERVSIFISGFKNIKIQKIEEQKQFRPNSTELNKMDQIFDKLKEILFSILSMLPYAQVYEMSIIPRGEKPFKNMVWEHALFMDIRLPNSTIFSFLTKMKEIFDYLGIEHVRIWADLREISISEFTGGSIKKIIHPLSSHVLSDGKRTWNPVKYFDARGYPLSYTERLKKLEKRLEYFEV